jgi:pterin-4a-carbinolamine dehydratase
MLSSRPKKPTTRVKTPTSIRSRSFSPSKSQIKPKKRQFHITKSPLACASTSCCGGTCSTPTEQAKKQVCDPYGLDNKPLDIDSVELQLEFVLENRWTYNKETNILSRSFNFSKTPLPPLEARVPGAPSGPCHGQGAAFTFMQAVNNISTNINHWPYSIEITPRKPQVVVGLKTVGRAGITYSDINIASQMDTFFSANMVPKGEQNNGI